MKLLLTFVFAVLLSGLQAQVDTVLLDEAGHFYFEDPFLPYSAYTSDLDELDRPFIYSACLELGLVTFEYDASGNIWPVDTLVPSVFAGLKPTNVWQESNTLYVSLGGYAGLIPQRAGLAVVDVSDPANMSLTAQWDSIAWNQGSAKVIKHGNTVFLGAMERGVIAIDVSDPADPQWLSTFLPDPDFPDIPGLFSTPNARGLCMYGDDMLLVCYDHGGLRMLDVSDPSNMTETGMYMNWDLYDVAAPAYNNVAVIGDYAYVPVDYCGLDVVYLAGDTMSNAFWFNPWECTELNWDGAPGHANEVRVVGDSLLFISGGDSEVLVFDVTDPSTPVMKGAYAYPGDSIVAWGMDVKDNLVSLALIDNSVLQVPYYSDKGGVMLLNMEVVIPADMQENHDLRIHLYPNPAYDRIHVSGLQTGSAFYSLRAMDGRILATGTIIDNGAISISALPSGWYQLVLTMDQNASTITMLKI
ncbi:MAG TPA: T9SS type A sorting domain-containing protein [Chitinophagales bacterium]|nr:T9SS type A sorting domain-containing protein [Chitinophagales bacterium]